MPRINVRTVMAVNGTANPLSGSQYEFLPFPAHIEIGIAADALGVLATVASGPDILQEEGPVTIKAINVGPVYPDDFILEDDAAQGDRLSVKLRDTSGVIRTVITDVRITPL